MFLIILLGLLGLTAAQQTSSLPTASVITNNVPGVSYGAVFDGTQGAGIKGYVVVTSNYNGTGVVVTTNLGPLPDQTPGGPFLYHIHAHSVAANGSCATALAHLDPTNRGESPPCDPSNPSSCQVGDLAGKFGKMTTSPWQETYTDLFISTTPDNPSSLVGKSLVIHDLNTTRIACVNFKLLSNAGTDCAASSLASTAVAPYPTSANVAPAAVSGAASPSGSVLASTGGSSSGTSSGSAVSSGAYSSRPAPSNTTSIVASNGATSLGASLGGFALAAVALIL